MAWMVSLFRRLERMEIVFALIGIRGDELSADPVIRDIGAG